MLIDGKLNRIFAILKSGRYGYALRETHIKSEERRDRLFLIIALCYTLLVLLGDVGVSVLVLTDISKLILLKHELIPYTVKVNIISVTFITFQQNKKQH
jgi:hypothetical protein